MSVVTPDTVRQLQADIQSDYDVVDAGVQKCNVARKLDDATLGQWFAMQDRVQAFLKMSPSWLSTATQTDQGQAIQKDLAAWHAKLAALGCDVGPAPTVVDPGPGLSNILTSSMQSLETILVIAALVYLVATKKR